MRKINAVLLVLFLGFFGITPAQKLSHPARIAPSTESKYNIDQEIALGRGLVSLAGYAEEKRVQDDLLQKYVQDLVNKLLLSSPRYFARYDYQVRIYNYSESTALSLSNGHIFLSLGMIRSAGSEDALAMVLAHEMSHVALRHMGAGMTLLEKLDHSRWESLLRAKDPKTIAQLFQLYDDVYYRFARRNELEADAIGTMIVMFAGYNPRSAFARLRGESIKPTKDHPSGSARIAAIDKETYAWQKELAPWQFRVQSQRRYYTARSRAQKLLRRNTTNSRARKIISRARFIYIAKSANKGK
jgi:predicted Zn-dependent protease